MLEIRSYRPLDAEVLGAVFHAAVQGADAYSVRQREAWCPAAPSGEAWAARLANADVVVAEIGREIVGFMTLETETGLVDLAFVHPDHARRGIGRAMVAMIEGRAKAAGLTRLSTDASLLLEPLLVKLGWTVVARQQVERHGQVLENCRMQKVLVPHS